jgi:hypothetical protein
MEYVAMERCPAMILARLVSRRLSMLLLALLLGCSKNEPEGPSNDGEVTTTAAVASNTPEQAVHEFMMAFKSGDEAKASDLVSQKTRQEMERTEYGVAPPGSKEMKFKVGEVQYVPESNDLARVACHIDDKDVDGEDVHMDVVWFLRKENPGWRIAGVAMKVFPDLPAVLYNFEDMDDMKRKLELVNEELVRRATQTIAQDPKSASGTGNQNAPEPTANMAELQNPSSGVRK